MAHTIVVAGFPGTGKSHFVNGDYVPDGFALDSDSSKFDKGNFPANYLAHIKEELRKDKAAVIFVSSHRLVREALRSQGIPYTLAYPNKTLKIEYIKRFIERGNDDDFIDLLYNNWDAWISECSNQKGCTHLVMNTGDYLSNILKF